MEEHLFWEQAKSFPRLSQKEIEHLYNGTVDDGISDLFPIDDEDIEDGNKSGEVVNKVTDITKEKPIKYGFFDDPHDNSLPFDELPFPEVGTSYTELPYLDESKDIKKENINSYYDKPVGSNTDGGLFNLDDFFNDIEKQFPYNNDDYEMVPTKVDPRDDRAEKRLFDAIFGCTEEREKELEAERIEQAKTIKEMERLEIEKKLTREKKEKYLKKRNERKYPTEEVRNKIVCGNLGLAIYLAKKYYYICEKTVDKDDLIQTAYEGLISAAHYYEPNGTAKFSTYASKCIENKLKKTIWKKKKRKNIAKHFFENEEEIMEKLKMFLDAEKTKNIWKSSMPKELDGTTKIIRMNRNIKYHNRCMYQNMNLNKMYKKVPSKYLRSGGRAANAKFNEMFNELINKIKNGKLNTLISNEERNIIDLYLNYKRIPICDQERTATYHYINLYLSKLKFMKQYIEIEKTLSKENDFIAPTEKEILCEMNKEVNEFNKQKEKLKKTNFFSRSAPQCLWYHDYCEEYKKEYGVDLMFDEGHVNRNKEKEDIIYNCAKYFEEQDEEDEYLKQELAKRKDNIRKILIEKNSVIKEKNIEILKLQKLYFSGKSYMKKYKEEQVRETSMDLSKLAESDDELFTLMYSGRNTGRSSPRTTVEDDAICNVFVEEYQNALNRLTYIEREVLNRYYDENGCHNMKAKEISEELHISVAEVYKVKTKALGNLRKDERISKYKEQ